MEKIIGVIDAVGHFATSFCNYVNEKKLLPYPAVAFTKVEAFVKSVETYEAVLLLVSEEFSQERESLPGCAILWLTEHTTDSERDLISRYQGADHLLKEILFRLGDNLLRREICGIRVTALYSPSSVGGQTSLALAYAHERAQKSRVLYLNLDNYAAFSRLTEGMEKDITDALFYFYEKSEGLQGRILSCIYRMDIFDMIAPSRCPMDLIELEEQELIDLVDYLKGLSLYDEIVVDMGSLIHKPWVFLHQCEQVLLPVRKGDPVGKEKRNAFYDFLEKTPYAAVLSRIKEVFIPWIESISGKEIGYEQMNCKELMEAIREAEL